MANQQRGQEQMLDRSVQPNVSRDRMLDVKEKRNHTSRH